MTKRASNVRQPTPCLMTKWTRVPQRLMPPSSQVPTAVLHAASSWGLSRGSPGGMRLLEMRRLATRAPNPATKSWTLRKFVRDEIKERHLRLRHGATSCHFHILQQLHSIRRAAHVYPAGRGLLAGSSRFRGTMARDLFLAPCVEHGSSEQPSAVGDKTARWNAEPWKASPSSRASLPRQHCRVLDGGHGTVCLLPLSDPQETVSGPKSGTE